MSIPSLPSSDTMFMLRLESAKRKRATQTYKVVDLGNVQCECCLSYIPIYHGPDVSIICNACLNVSNVREARSNVYRF